MWIIPKNLQLSSGAPDTAGFISDLNEQSQICASSLMVRSKPSQPRIWSQKWKRDSWTQHLSGRILKPSHARSFATAWASLSPVIPASHFQQQASVSEPKTIATSGRTSQEQLELFAPDFVSSRMSKDISASDSAKSLESWEQSVTRRRGEYSARVKSGRLTRGSESSSWPTISVNESKNSVGKSQLNRNSIPLGTMVAMQQSLVSSAAMSLTTAFSENTAAQTAKEVDWRTPTTEAMGTGAHMDSAKLKLGHRVYNKNGKVMAIDLNRQMDIVQRLHGLPAPANPSTLGSRQGSSWATPQSRDAKGAEGRMIREGQHTDLPSQIEVAPTGQWNRANGKLNPRWVETLMGLPVGWTMPSCKSPVTIALTNCASSATESCQQQQNELFAF